MSPFKSIEKKKGLYRDKDCAKILKGIHNEDNQFFFKKRKLLTSKHQKSYENAKNFYICKGKAEHKYATDKKYLKLKDHFHYTVGNRGDAHRICNLKYSVTKQILKKY